MYNFATIPGRPSQNTAALLTLGTFFLLFLSGSGGAAAASPPAPAPSATAPPAPAPTLPVAYVNYTVGDSLGWYDRLENPKVDYQKWAAGKNFSLGDFLIFNTDNNHSVIQTYNLTTYKRCDSADASDNDTTQWSTADPSSTSPQPVSVAVPLLKVGQTYFFSGDYEGDQCNNGQHFSINVTYGNGLPPDLQSPSDEALAPGNPDNADATPDTLVPSNFDNPQNVSDDNNDSSKSTTTISSFSGVKFYGVLILLGFYGTI